MVKTSWTDLDCDGRRLERIIKLCETRVSTEISRKGTIDHDLVLAYIDRLIKASNQKLAVTDMVLGIKALRKLAEKQYLEQITHDRLLELKSK